MSGLKKSKANLEDRGLSEGDLKIISELKKAIEDDKLIITCMGLYNHGKSSLLNALIKDFEGKTFKTADTRETTVNKRVMYKGFTFVDTPGLNAQKNDDKRVMDAVKTSDMNIFVHNVNTGEFVASEVEFFHRVKKRWDSPEAFIDRTIFVLSRIDEANSGEDIKNTAMKMKQQLKDIFGVDACVIPVSSKDYVDGMIEKEDELIGISNITMLEDQLTQLQRKFIEPIRQTKKARLVNHYDSMIKKLSSQLQKKKVNFNQLRNEQKRLDTALKNDLQKIESTLVQKYEALEAV